MTLCAIDGCPRQTSRQTGEWISSVHWRRHCPPRSRRRRAYHAFFQRAKRHGWDDDLRRRFWLFWDTLVRAANAAERRDTIDMTEINKLFGWSD